MTNEVEYLFFKFWDILFWEVPGQVFWNKILMHLKQLCFTFSLFHTKIL